MVKASIVITGILLMALAMPIQHSFSTTKTLDLIIYQDGATHVFTEIEADPLGLDYEVDLFGYDIDNFVAVGENGFLLSSEINDDVATVETFGDSTISVNFDIHDLVSKESRIWTFTIDSPTDFSLLMPRNVVIVGMSSLPINMEIIDEQIQLILPSGSTEINYVFGTPIITNPDDSSLPISAESNNSLIFAGIGIVAAGAIGAIIIKKSRGKKNTTQISKESIQVTNIDLETIFKLKPDLRDDDKEIVKFIFDNGGQALESELRKKFLLPRTTMWRAVKRLEREEIIEIDKKDMQNLVKLKKTMEDTQ